jgi:hypothetical protein
MIRKIVAGNSGEAITFSFQHLIRDFVPLDSYLLDWELRLNEAQSFGLSDSIDY